MKGVRPHEIDDWVARAQSRISRGEPRMEIVCEKGGYRMQLCSDLHRIRDRMYGKVKETRLNQAAIDCLALVAYQPGIDQQELERHMESTAASVLRMLFVAICWSCDARQMIGNNHHAFFFLRNGCSIFLVLGVVG